jgi:hypothetical protein
MEVVEFIGLYANWALVVSLALIILIVVTRSVFSGNFQNSIDIALAFSIRVFAISLVLSFIVMAIHIIGYFVLRAVPG